MAWYVVPRPAIVSVSGEVWRLGLFGYVGRSSPCVSCFRALLTDHASIGISL